MFLWFVGCSFAAVWSVFRSPALDHRVVMAASVLPLLEVVAGRPMVLHTAIGASLIMAVVMVTLHGHRRWQRRWLGLPIGLYAHLVLDGTWADQRLFWWPFFGWDFHERALPEAGPVLLVVVQELAGLVALGWMVRTFRLTEPGRRREFLTQGRLGRDLVA